MKAVSWVTVPTGLLLMSSCSSMAPVLHTDHSGTLRLREQWQEVVVNNLFLVIRGFPIERVPEGNKLPVVTL